MLPRNSYLFYIDDLVKSRLTGPAAGTGVQYFHINQSIIVYTLRIKSLLPSLYEREEFPSLAKRG
jgi:hypothetical protein